MANAPAIMRRELARITKRRTTLKVFLKSLCLD
jgi:hypothetical protein